MTSSSIGDSLFIDGAMKGLGDRYIVTVLFADIVSSTRLTAELDPDDIREIQDHATGIMANAVRAYEGSVVRFQGDGIEAVFGTPKPAEDHALRACLAGLAIQKSFRTDPFARFPGARPRDSLWVRIGIHSGLVIAREMNSDLGHGVDLLGATVSIARLAEKVCPAGSVAATSVTAELAGAYLQSRPFVPAGHELADHYDFVEVLGVDLSDAGLAMPRPDDTAFVNRTEEQQLVFQTLDTAHVGGSVVVMIGDPGIGKSRLSAEIACSVAARQMPVHSIRGLSLLQATPYAALRPVLSLLLGLKIPSDTALASEVAAKFGMDENELAAFLDLLSIVAAGTEGPRRTGHHHGETLQDAFCATVIKAWGASPGLLVVDDFQLLDPETANCLRKLARRIGETPIVMLVNGRPEASEALQRLSDTVVNLAPLSKDHTIDLVNSLAPEIGGDTDLADRIVSRSGGVPFILEQILRTGFRHGESFNETILPTNVVSIVLARLNRLSPQAKQLAQVASVLGEESDRKLLLATAANYVELQSPEAALSELVDTGFFAPLGGEAVRFKHSLLRDACFDSLVRPGRQYLHAQALTCLEHQYDTLTPYLEQLAYHAEGAGRDDLALEYLWEATRNAARNSAVHSLEVLFGRAMACCDRMGSAAEMREVDFVLLAFDALQQYGKLANVVPRLGRAVKLAEQQGRRDKECLARTHLATVLYFDAQNKEGSALAEPAVVIARQLQTPPALAYAQLTCANLRYGCGDIQGAVDMLQANVDFLVGDLERSRLGAVGLPSVMSRAFLSWYMVDLGQFQEAENTIARAIEIADLEGLPYSKVLAHIARARISFVRGDYAAALDVLKLVRDLCWQFRIYAMEPTATGLLASTLSRVGAAPAGVAVAEASFARQFYRGAARIARFYLNAGYAEALYASGDRIRGIEVARETVEQNEARYDPCTRALGHLVYAELLADSGEREASQASFQRALEIAVAIGMKTTVAKTHGGLAILAKNNPCPEFSSHAREAERLYLQLGLHIPDALKSLFRAQQDHG